MMRFAFKQHATHLYKQIRSRVLDFQAVFAEFVGMVMFITISCATAVGLSDLSVSRNAENDAVYYDQAIHAIGTAMAFGFTITALAYATAHTSGGQFNPAVSIGVFLASQLSLLQCIANVAAQVAGAILGAGIVDAIQPGGGENIGANKLRADILPSQAFLAEAIGTFTLVFVVLETACNSRSVGTRMLAPVAIGFTVFVLHLFLIPYTSASINPARSLGPAIVSGTWQDLWVFTIGPLVGGIVAMPVHLLMTEPFEVVAMYRDASSLIADTDGHMDVVSGPGAKEEAKEEASV